MKKLLSLTLALFLTFCLFLSVGCAKDNSTYVFACPDGAPALAISKLMNDKNSLGLNAVDYKVVSAKEIGAQMTEGQADLILMPINAASKFYKAHSAENPYLLVAVVTHGNFYVMSTKQLSVADLAGEQVAVPNMNAVPDWTFQSAMIKNGLTIGEQGVKVKYYADGAQIVQMMNAGEESIGIVPEPAATNLEKNFANNQKTIYRMDLQELYDGQTKAYPQAVLMVKKSVLTENLYDRLSQEIDKSVVWAKENTQTAVSVIKEKFPTTLNAKTLSPSAIDGCKIYFEGANSAKQSVIKYIEDIRSINANSANQVADDFFYSK